ncbi:MAG: type II toxin-antitoxin system Phd/YefM family antitoxin [Opitutales bacterium]
MKKVNIYAAKTQLSRLVQAVEEEGELVVLCRNGKPVADLVPHAARKAKLEPLPELKGAQYIGDPCAPLGEEDWPESLR